MKKVDFKSILTIMAVAFTLLFVGMEGANAQSASLVDSPLTPPQGNFVDANQAQVVLDEQLSILKDVLSQLTITDPTFAAVEIKYVYYQGIDASLKSGSSVPKAIVEGLAPFMTENYNLNTAQINMLKADATALLDI